MQLFLASVLLVFVAVAIAPGEGVRCYECIYAHTKDCKDPSVVNVKTCSGNACGKIYGEKDGIVYLHRACEKLEHHKDECGKANLYIKDMTWCVCTSDLCNGASFQSVSVVSMVTLVLCAACASRWL